MASELGVRTRPNYRWRSHKEAHMTWAKRIFCNIAFLLSIIITGGAQATASAQQTGSTTLSGTVTLGDTGTPVHGASVTILQLRRTVSTDDNGKYEFQNVPPGNFDVAAHLDRANDVVQRVVVPGSGSITQDFRIQLSGVRETVTVTATGTEESVS